MNILMLNSAVAHYFFFIVLKGYVYEKANFKQIICMCCIIFHAIDYNLDDVCLPWLHLLIDLF